MRFTKMQSLGNDFLVVDDRDGAAVDWATLAPVLCDRRRGVGADGVLLVGRADPGFDLRMRLVNAGGDEAEMCGNGVRCTAILAAQRGFAGPRLTWQTGAGPIRTELVGEGLVRVDMGAPRFAPAEVPVAVDGDDALNLTIELGGADGTVVRAAAVGMGNPHCVVLLDDQAGETGVGGWHDLGGLDVGALGPRIETHPVFPQRANVEFVTVTGPARVRQRTWERGVGETEACGTGACAAVVALQRRGLVGASVDVELRGGLLHIDWAGAGPVWMTGPAVMVFEGDVDLATLRPGSP